MSIIGMILDNERCTNKTKNTLFFTFVIFQDKNLSAASIGAFVE